LFCLSFVHRYVLLCHENVFNAIKNAANQYNF
jgi:hypothetical protein